eukprot:scpid53263/ scgid4691/ Carbohydrate sulfotransferase 14; Dermatan 4-sulfotransferase 1
MQVRKRLRLALENIVLFLLAVGLMTYGIRLLLDDNDVNSKATWSPFRLKRSIAGEELQLIAKDVAVVRGVLDRRKKIQQQPVSRHNYINTVEKRCSLLRRSHADEQDADPLQHIKPGRRALLLEHLLYNDDMQVIYCALPKVASHNWRSVLLSLSDNLRHQPTYYQGVYKDANARRFKSLAELNNRNEIRMRLRTYFKYMMVRNPANRLVSLYLDKFSSLARKSDFRSQFGNRVKQQNKLWKKYNPRLMTNYTHESGRFSYQEVMRFIASQRPVARNEHWVPMNDLCRPCDIRYDFIGKIEEAPNSSASMMEAIGLPSTVAFPGRDSQVSYHHKAVDDKMVQEMNSLLIPAEYMAVHDVYAADYLIFDYKRSPYLSWKTNPT